MDIARSYCDVQKYGWVGVCFFKETLQMTLIDKVGSQTWRSSSRSWDRWGTLLPSRSLSNLRRSRVLVTVSVEMTRQDYPLSVCVYYLSALLHMKKFLSSRKIRKPHAEVTNDILCSTSHRLVFWKRHFSFKDKIKSSMVLKERL